MAIESRHTVHVTEADFALLQLAGEVMRWEPGGYMSQLPKWWTQHWVKGGNFLCTCGAEEAKPL